MKVSYPNAFDRAKGAQDGRDHLGGDIFIHGKTLTVGCIPIGNAAIEALFLMVAEIGIDQVEVIIAPYDLRTEHRVVEVGEIEWESELYTQIRARLLEL